MVFFRLLEHVISGLFCRTSPHIIIVQLDDDADQHLAFPHQFAQAVARIYNPTKPLPD